MTRLVAFVVGLSMIPSMASATDLGELLERGRDASYSAEQMITCSTPDGVRDALLRIEQAGPEILIGSGVASDTAVAIGAGGWMLLHEDGVVDEARVESTSSDVESSYLIEDLGAVSFMGRGASAYRLGREGIIRAELVLDDETGVLVRGVTFDAGGNTYCVRRFVSFEPGERELPPKHTSGQTELSPVETVGAEFPESVAGFTRLDQYEDADGFRFTYYSDGFFSFAVFQTPARVDLPEATEVKFGQVSYRRSFTAGQVIYVWEARASGMAMVGDLPPDLHGSVLASLPQPHDPGLFRRLWRTLFG
jgi:hypothetical protein